MDQQRQRRREPRKKPDRLIEAFIEGGQPAGKVVNLTLNGLMLVHDTTLTLNTPCVLTLKYLHKNIPVIIDLKVEFLWRASAPDDAGSYWSGCQILEMDSDARQVLTNLLETLAEE